MKLTNEAKQVLSAVELDALRDNANISKLTKLMPHVVAYQLRKLEVDRILGPARPSINLYKLGYTDYAFYFSVRESNRLSRQQFIKVMQETPNITWCAEVGAEYNFAASIMSKSSSQVKLILNRIAEKVAGSFNGDLVIRQRVESYGRKYLSQIAHKSSVLGYGGLQENHVLAELDREILLALISADSTSHRRISQIIGANQSTVSRRISALQSKGIINGFYHPYDPSTLGVSIFNLLIATPLPSEKLSNDLRKFAKSHLNCVHFVECFGAWSFEFVIECFTPIEASQIATELKEHFGTSIKSINILPVFKYIKGSALPEV